MNYELALKLKDAGFPQENTGYCCYFIYPDRFGYLETIGSQPKEDYIKRPPLSELIEACNPTQFDEFGISCGYHDQWEARAVYHGYAIPEVDLCIRGSTPEESVANLWLELNKK